jgi:hypothetical protein
LFLLVGLCLIIFTQNYPVGDFGNYYYGSKLFIDSKFSVLDYQSISHFNQQICSYGESHFFENYTPVPPFSLIVYLPFVFLSCLKAKVVFNLISLIFFCFSLQRLLSYYSIEGWQAYLIPFIFLSPLYNCIYQGQSYLIITAFLMESFLASEKSKYWLSAFCLALCISLKLFPVFMVVYFVLKKEYRIAIYSIILTLILFLVTLLFIDTDIILYYVKEVLPRLLNNDIIGCYYHGNQSIYTFLLNLFSFDENQNNHPVINFPWLVPVIEGVAITFFLIVLISFRKQSPILVFGFTIFCSVLIGRYNTSYGMLILIPFLVGIIVDTNLTKFPVILFVVFTLAISSPVGSFLNQSMFLQFSRLLGLVLVFCIFLILYKPVISLKYLCVLGTIVITIKCLSFSVTTIQYFSLQNSKGILYDYIIQNDSITLISTVGDKDFEETFPINAEAHSSEELYVKGKDIIYKGQVICNTKDHKMKPFLYKDTSVVFLSDLNQAIGLQ